MSKVNKVIKKVKYLISKVRVHPEIKYQVIKSSWEATRCVAERYKNIYLRRACVPFHAKILQLSLVNQVHA
jgi:hypothetical protein